MKKSKLRYNIMLLTFCHNTTFFSYLTTLLELSSILLEYKYSYVNTTLSLKDFHR